MTPHEAADLITVIRSEIIKNPNQFTVEISITGQNIVSNGGIGMNVSVTGGGPGSHTIGNQVSMGGANIQLAQKQVNGAMTEQLNSLIAVLDKIILEIKNQNPDKSKIQTLINSLKNTWVPGVIIGVIGNAVSKSIGV